MLAISLTITLPLALGASGCRSKPKAKETLTVLSLLGRDPVPEVVAKCYFVPDGGPTCKRNALSEMVLGKLCARAHLEFEACAAAFRVDGGALGLELDDKFIMIEDVADYERRVQQ